MLEARLFAIARSVDGPVGVFAEASAVIAAKQHIRKTDCISGMTMYGLRTPQMVTRVWM